MCTTLSDNLLVSLFKRKSVKNKVYGNQRQQGPLGWCLAFISRNLPYCQRGSLVYSERLTLAHSGTVVNDKGCNIFIFSRHDRVVVSLIFEIVGVFGECPLLSFLRCSRAMPTQELLYVASTGNGKLPQGKARRFKSWTDLTPVDRTNRHRIHVHFSSWKHLLTSLHNSLGLSPNDNSTGVARCVFVLYSP